MVNQRFNRISGEIAQPIVDMLERVSDTNQVRAILRRLFRLGMVPVRDEARSLAPVQFGDMSRAHKIRAGRRRNDRVTMRTTVEISDLDIEGDRAFYPIAVHNGFTTRDGRKTEGDPWMFQAAMRRRREAGQIIESRFVDEYVALAQRRGNRGFLN